MPAFSKNFRDSIKKLHINKKIIISVFCVLLGFIILSFDFQGDKSKNKSNENTNMIEYSKSVENKILELCSKVQGVSKVSVAVSFESGYQYVYAQNQSKGDFLTIGSGSSESAVKVTEIPPRIAGIGIVCKGGGDARIQNKLLCLISSAYGISSNKIYIAEAKNN